MARIPAVSSQEWSDLYQAADAFRELAPWQWMYDAHTFAVMNPEQPQAGYCVVLGNLGEVFGLAVYLGAEGLALLEELLAEDMPPNPNDILLKKQCLIADFVGSGDLDKEDKAVLKGLGLKYRGRNAWPVFRSYRPGAAPWFLEAWEARFLTVCLRQAAEVGARLRENPELLAPPRDELYFFRMAETKDGRTQWLDRWVEPEPFRAPALPRLMLDEVRLAAVKARAVASGAVWQMDLTIIPVPIMERERPYYPRCFMTADQASGFILSAEPMDPAACHSLLLPRLLDLIENTGALPGAIQFRSAELRSLLHEPLEKMGIKTKFVRELPAIDVALFSMGEFFVG